MANRSETYKLAWRVVRRRYHDMQGGRRLPDHEFQRLAEFIGILIDGALLDALPRGAESAYWDEWHEPSDFTPPWP